MPAIVLQQFRGERPRVIPRMLEGNGAQEAINARLDDGALTPINRPARVAEIEGAEGHQTIYRHGDEWLSWEGLVHVAPGPVAADRLYLTGDGVPKVRVGGDEYPLAVPRPPTAPTATLSGTGDGDVVTRVYVHTWVTAMGEESEPSPASVPIDWQPGNTITLSSFDAVPEDREIEKQRIYRSQTGQTGTYFYLIAERDADDTDFIDDIPVDAFQERLPSADWNAPPDDLAGLTAMPNGMMAAFSGRRLFFCEPWHPHAWPEKYVLTTDTDIVGLASAGSMLFVLTKTYPYVVHGTHPATMTMEKSETNLPCINPRGIVDLGYAVCYPSHGGLVLLDSSGAAGLCTEALFGRQEWLRYGPATMIGAQHGGRYVAFCTYQGTPTTLIIAVGADADLRRSNAKASAAFYDVETGGLFYLRAGTNDVWRFDDPNSARHDLFWRSKEFILAYEENFGAIQIDADTALSGEEAARAAAETAAVVAANQAVLDLGGVGGELGGSALGALALGGDVLAPLPPAGPRISVTVYADGEMVKQVVATNRPQRLPSGFTARKWEIEVAGNLSVSRIVMAKTMDELQQVG